MNKYDRPCPRDDELYVFAEGQSDESEIASLKAHVGSCRKCRELVLDAIQLKAMSRNLKRCRVIDRDFERIEKWIKETASSLEAKGTADSASEA